MAITIKTREVPKIDLSNFDQRYEQNADQLWEAATSHGFFALYNQASPNVEDIEKIFEKSQQFFNLAQAKKLKTLHIKLLNSGYKYKAQIRPSSTTKVPENKESIQLQLHRKKS